MYQILVAGPTENSSRSNLAAVAKTAAFFTSDCAECRGSLDVNDVDLCDALVVPGGIADVDPAFYGEENVACGEIDTALDEQQLKMIARAVEQKKPVFGICRGLQLICVHFGAALVQDIACSAEHKPAAKGEGCFHKVYSVPGSAMETLYGKTAQTNSLHHQAVGKLPPCLAVTQLWCRDESRIPDLLEKAARGELQEVDEETVIEAVEHKAYPFFGLQWHPELGKEHLCSEIDTLRIRDYFYQLIKESQQVL